MGSAVVTRFASPASLVCDNLDCRVDRRNRQTQHRVRLSIRSEDHGFNQAGEMPWARNEFLSMTPSVLFLLAAAITRPIAALCAIIVCRLTGYAGLLSAASVTRLEASN